jgi:hypothetical protein
MENNDLASTLWLITCRRVNSGIEETHTVFETKEMAEFYGFGILFKQLDANGDRKYDMVGVRPITYRKH